MENITFPDRNSLRAKYDELLPARTLVVKELEARIEEAILPLSSQARVTGRIKSFESYFKKCLRYLKDGVSASSLRITDLIGIRIICPFLEDLAAVEELLEKKFNVIEVDQKGGDHTYREFGYESIHLLIAVPEDIITKRGITGGETSEIQIRTVLQDAWAEVEHEFVYKAEFSPFDNPLKRKLAAVNASLSLVDIIFQEIRSYQRKLYIELEKRRDSFFRKIEESTDEMLLSEEESLAIGKGGDFMPPHSEKALSDFQSYWTPAEAPGTVSIDALLVNALTAHNKNDFPQAIAIYTQILDMNPEDSVRSLILKHRGMAFFARSHYEAAISDFSESFRLDPKSYKAAYYEGVVCSVLQRYPQAVDAFSRSLKINPYQPYCLFRRGQAYYHLEDYPKALGDCEAALALESFEAAGKFKEMVLTKLKM